MGKTGPGKGMRRSKRVRSRTGFLRDRREDPLPAGSAVASLRAGPNGWRAKKSVSRHGGEAATGRAVVGSFRRRCRSASPCSGVEWRPDSGENQRRREDLMDTFFATLMEDQSG